MGSKKGSVYMPKQHKFGIIYKMHEYKHVLFNQFHDTGEDVTRAEKAQAWKEVYQYSVANEWFPRDRDVDFLRNTFWHNAKGSTLLKMKRYKESGFVNYSDKFTETDYLILDMLGMKEDLASLPQLDFMQPPPDGDYTLMDMSSNYGHAENGNDEDDEEEEEDDEEEDDDVIEVTTELNEQFIIKPVDEEDSEEQEDADSKEDIKPSLVEPLNPPKQVIKRGLRGPYKKRKRPGRPGAGRPKKIFKHDIKPEGNSPMRLLRPAPIQHLRRPMLNGFYNPPSSSMNGANNARGHNQDEYEMAALKKHYMELKVKKMELEILKLQTELGITGTDEER